MLRKGGRVPTDSFLANFGREIAKTKATIVCMALELTCVNKQLQEVILAYEN